MLDPYEGSFEDFNQMVIQFGYIALFAPACAAAPFLALVNNVTEIRTDAYKVISMHKRPHWKPQAGIGAWNDVVKTLAVAAVLVNTTMVCFVGSKMSEEFKPEINDTVDADIFRRMGIAKLWIVCLLLEHAILILRSFLMTMAPDEPKWVDEAKDTIDFKVSQMRTEDALISSLADDKAIRVSLVTVVLPVDQTQIGRGRDLLLDVGRYACGKTFIGRSAPVLLRWS